MKISPETKHVLIIGGALIAAVVLGIIVYKKFEANSQASQAANDQSTQDQLAYLESMELDGGGYSDFGETSGGSSITLPSAPTSESLAQEIQGIESAFGFGTTSSGSTSSGSSSGSSAASSTDAGAAAAENTHSLGSSVSSPSSTPRAAAVSGFSGSYWGTPIVSGVYSLDDEPVGREGSYVA